MGRKLPLACYVVSSALVIAFIVKSIIDYTRYLESYVPHLFMYGCWSMPCI